MKIPFNKPYKTDVCLSELSTSKLDEKEYINAELSLLGFNNYLLTHSCTASLELIVAAMDLQQGDEIILPTYTYVSTANAFAIPGVVLKFADSAPNHPNISLQEIERLSSPKTKAVVVVHYAGQANDLAAIQAFCKQQNILLIEDAAHAFDADYNGQSLGTFGDASALSFHHTKNVHCYSGGLVNFSHRDKFNSVESIYYKGTDKAEFIRNKVAKYQWVSKGSSYHINELALAFLAQQIQLKNEIKHLRLNINKAYFEQLHSVDNTVFQLPIIDKNAAHNGHIFYLKFRSAKELVACQNKLAANGIQSLTHYHCLHKSPYGKQFYQEALPNAEQLENCLLRLPIYPDLSNSQINYICEQLIFAVKK